MSLNWAARKSCGNGQSLRSGSQQKNVFVLPLLLWFGFQLYFCCLSFNKPCCHTIVLSVDQDQQLAPRSCDQDDNNESLLVDTPAVPRTTGLVTQKHISRFGTTDLFSNLSSQKLVVVDEPEIRSKPWGCSSSTGPWNTEGHRRQRSRFCSRTLQLY